METKRQTEKARTANSTYKKLAVQWLDEALCFAWRDFVVAERLVLSNYQLLVAANLSSLNDKDFAVSAEEKKVTQDFYQLKK